MSFFYTNHIVLQQRVKSLRKYTDSPEPLLLSYTISNVANDPDQNIFSRHNWRVLVFFVHMQVTDL